MFHCKEHLSSYEQWIDMNKTEQIHRYILQKKIVNKNDLKDISIRVLGQKDTQYLQRKYLSNIQDDLFGQNF